MATDAQIHSLLVRWLAARLEFASGKVIKAFPDGPRPVLPYVMVNLTGSRTVREHEQTIEFAADAPGTEPNTAGEYPPVEAAPVIEREWFFSVHMHGPAPTDLLRPIESAARMLQTMEPIYPDIVIHEISRVRNVPEWVNNLWEPRANVDIFLRGLTRDGFDVDVIDDIEPTDIAIIRG